MIFNRSLLAALMLLSTFFWVSCAGSREVRYFAGQEDSRISSENKIPENTLQANDLLSITVTSLNQDASASFNTPNLIYNNPTSSSEVLQASGYLIRSNGTIQFPVLGNIKAEGLTSTQLGQEIEKQLSEKKLLVGPIVNVRLLNFRVSVLGEVGHPTVINVPNEKISLLEALGLAGDITIFGNKHNVMVIREEANEKIIKRLDLNATDLIGSPYYYLKPNDIVYVEPNKARVTSSTRSVQLLPVLLSGLSFAAIIVDRLTR